jgi:hypothetical protein
VLALEVEWQGSGSKTVLLQTDYEDSVTNIYTRQIVSASFADPVSLRNGNYSQRITLVLSNTLDRTVEFESGLTVISEPGQIVGFNCTMNSNPMEQRCWAAYDELYLPSIFLGPRQTSTIVVDVEYM